MNRLDNLRSKAWLLRGVSSLPGVLSLREGRLSFQAEDSGSFWPRQLRKLEQQTMKRGIADRIQQNEHTVIFDSALSDVREIVFPWYYFSGGLKLSIKGVHYRFSFVPPVSTRVSDDVRGQLKGIGEGRGEGRVWKEALCDRSSFGF